MSLSPSPVDSAKGEVSATVTVHGNTVGARVGRPRHPLGNYSFTSMLLGVLIGTLIGFSITSSASLVTLEPLLIPAIWRNYVSPTKTSISEDPSLETLRDMAARTRGYWARDYSLQLGWNNVRNYST
jgi:hypothetical protein